ncbi:proton-associated sugar transporter A [Uranotaenia lowii]|uniref:proton-associated sugar transporter A n=1 Tax=Uranotaenia lowii TaxID=190385 RepID=UPI00247854AA|nr:proton-associated sugar transporter A [Uranotaenia lowii]
MEKLHGYQGWTGRLHEFKDSVREKHAAWKEQRAAAAASASASGTAEGGAPTGGIAQYIRNSLQGANRRQDDGGGAGAPWNEENVDFSHIYRKKSRMELVRVSAAVMGIEFSYAAETAFVSPTLLKIGVQHQHMTLVWCLSPLVGFFLTPVLGSLSDRCRSNYGRRRPFILMLSLGVLLGLLLVPNGEDFGYAMGDPNPYVNSTVLFPVQPQPVLPHRSTAQEAESVLVQDSSTSVGERPSHPWGIFFTILGTVLLDFDADACQSPSRAYLIDVTIPEDHARGLSTFTIMAGLGGFMGYSLGGINWDDTFIGQAFGGHVRAVFSLITIIFVICVMFTITSFNEIPLWILEQEMERQEPPIVKKVTTRALSEQDSLDKIETSSYGALEEDIIHNQQNQQRRFTMPASMAGGTKREYDELPGKNCAETSFNSGEPIPIPETGGCSSKHDHVTLSMYLKSIVIMPHSLRMVCLTNLFCWMAHVCYSLYFTDFVGEAVFNGNPKALDGTDEYIRYEEGVRFGCWGMAMYSLSCACYSLIIEQLIRRFRAKKVYVGGLLFYCCGMSLMALTKHKVGVIVFSWAAGVMYSTLFTMPYLLVAHYHSEGIFEQLSEEDAKQGKSPVVRGLGTDVAIVSSMVFLAQFILSICMGSLVSWSGTTTAVVTVAAFLSFCGAIAATQVVYLDL